MPVLMLKADLSTGAPSWAGPVGAYFLFSIFISVFLFWNLSKFRVEQFLNFQQILSLNEIRMNFEFDRNLNFEQILSLKNIQILNNFVSEQNLILNKFRVWTKFYFWILNISEKYFV
jgi:hypothetical protein